VRRLRDQRELENIDRANRKAIAWLEHAAVREAAPRLPPSSRFRSAHWRLMAAVAAGRLSNGQAISLAKQSDHENERPGKNGHFACGQFGEIFAPNGRAASHPPAAGRKGFLTAEPVDYGSVAAGLRQLLLSRLTFLQVA
jgi:hypothetical protein